GPRVPFRIGSGQYLMGATMRQKIGSRLTIGARLLRVSTSDAALMDNAALLPSNRQYLNASNAAVQSSFEWTKHLKLFGEAGLAGGSLAPSAFANSGGTATPATITGSAPLTLLA